MESSSTARYIFQKLKKRLFPGSSSSCMEPDVIEIALPSADQTSSSKAEVVFHEITDVDMDEERNDVVFIDGKVEPNKKLKGSTGISVDPRNASQFDSNNTFNSPKNVESSNKGKDVLVEPEPANSFTFTQGSNNFFDLDDYYVSDDDYDDYSALQAHFDNMDDLPTGIEAPVPWLLDLDQVEKKIHSLTKSLKQSQSQSQPNFVDQLKNHLELNEASPSVDMLTDYGDICTEDMLMGQETINGPNSGPIGPNLVGSSSTMGRLDNDGALERYGNFKKFDTVVDFSDHLFAKQNSVKQPPKNWAKKIQDEWRILEKDLPDTIFVRVYESRMDLLRAVIIGAEGTPYHDGLFFFDVCFPSNYPNSPPLVKYHSGGLHINPNLYKCGKVCLSLLNTWSGGESEKWQPGVSTMLQVLVSIQGLILNAKPYFNEPGYARLTGSVHGEKRSLQYSENTLILSLKTMVYTMNKPPKYFEDLVIGHFRNRARDILTACKAYTEGVQVGCFVKGGVQGNNGSCSTRFKTDIILYIKVVIGAFKKIGANEAVEFLYLSKKKISSTSTSTSVAAATLVIDDYHW